MSSKARNKKIKSANGNGKLRQNISIIHWNMGSKAWQNKKTEIELVIMQQNPDIFIISEANLKNQLSENERGIPGFKLVLPKTAEARDMIRIVMLIREGIQYELLSDYMDTIVASIWIKIGAKGRKPLALAGIYREHRYLEQGPNDTSHSDQAQLDRWVKFVDTWTLAATRYDVMVLGDTNVDKFKWNQSEGLQTKLIDKVKDEVESIGFVQMVEGATRSWSNQPDSQIDQCWLNAPIRLVHHKNLVRAFSDHNLIVTLVRTRDRLKTVKL